MIMDKLAETHGQVSVICGVVISFVDEKSVSIQNFLDNAFVCLMNICAVGSAEIKSSTCCLNDVQSAFW